MTGHKPHIIVNPASAAGKTGKRLREIVDVIRSRLKEEFTLDVTGKPHDATHSARAAIGNGATLIIAVGGDGTVQEVLNGFSYNGTVGDRSCHLGIVGSGTARDITRNLQLPRELHRQVDVAVYGSSRLVDVGKVEYTDFRGNRVERLFINECQQGIAATVVERVSSKVKLLGGFLGFGLTALSSLARHKGQEMSVTVDDRETFTGSFLGVVIANGCYAGGGMALAPRARMDDGLLEVVLIRDMIVPSRLVNFPKIYVGKHIDLPWVEYRRGRRVTVTSPQTVLTEADGELLGSLPCTVEIMPQSVNIKSALSSPSPLAA